MYRHLAIAILAILSSIQVASAIDVPGGMIRTAEPGPSNTYELLLSPGYVLNPSGAYLTSEMRYQPSEEVGFGFGFGAGEVGFNFGLSGIWHALPDTSHQPAFGVGGGIFFNRFDTVNYFVVRATPMVSKSFPVEWGRLSPYAGMHIAPSFRLGELAANQLSIKTALGTQLAFKTLKGVNLWWEFGVGIANSMNEVIVGFSYPFQAL